MELKTPLYDAHVKAGGKIVEFGGYLPGTVWNRCDQRTYVSTYTGRTFRCLTYGRGIM